LSIIYYDRNIYLGRQGLAAPEADLLYYLRSVDNPELTGISNPFAGTTWRNFAYGTKLAPPRFGRYRNILFALTQDAGGWIRFWYKDPNVLEPPGDWYGGWANGVALRVPSVASAEHTVFQDPTKPYPQEVYAVSALTTSGYSNRHVNVFRSIVLSLAHEAPPGGSVDRIVFSNAAATWNNCPDCNIKLSCTTSAQGGWIPCDPVLNLGCPQGYSCGVVSAESFVCQKTCSGTGDPVCGPSESCTTIRDGVDCGPAPGRSGAENETPFLNEFGAGMMSWPRNLLNDFKLRGQQVLTVSPDCSKGPQGGSTTSTYTIRLSGGARRYVSFHEMSHAFQTIQACFPEPCPAPLVVPTPATYSVGFQYSFWVGSAGAGQPCSPACSVPPCSGCRPPLICNGQICAPRACATSAECTVGPSFAWPPDACLVGSTGLQSCNRGRPYGYVTGYATSLPCETDVGCENFAEAATYYRFGGTAFRSIADYDWFSVQFAHKTHRSCQHYNYLKGYWFAGAAFDGEGNQAVGGADSSLELGSPTRTVWSCPDQ
jgi:hypothetical protein